MLGSVQQILSCVYSMNGMCVSFENMAVCTEIKLCCIFVCCFMFDYENSRPTLRHFTKGEMAHSPESIHMVCSILMIVFSILHFSVL